MYYDASENRGDILLQMKAKVKAGELIIVKIYNLAKATSVSHL